MEPKQQKKVISAQTVAVIALLGFVVGFILGALTYRQFRPVVELPVLTIQRDTVVDIDTLRVPVPPPLSNGVVRKDSVRVLIKTQKDTVYVPVPADTVKSDTGVRLTPDGQVVVDIEQKIYKTDDYRAVIEGWRPQLVSMEVYPKTKTITNTVTRLQKPRWSVSVGAGVGYTGERIAPHIGVTAGYVLWSQ